MQHVIDAVLFSGEFVNTKLKYLHCSETGHAERWERGAEKRKREGENQREKDNLDIINTNKYK